MSREAYSRREFLRLAGLAEAATVDGCQRATRGPAPAVTATFSPPSGKLLGDLLIL